MLDADVADRLGLSLIDGAAYQFYDAQTLRRRHVVQTRRRHQIGFETTLSEPVPLTVAGEVIPYVLFHTSGFVIIRLTLVNLSADSAELSSSSLFQLHRRLWSFEPDVYWRFEDQEQARAGTLRAGMNRVFLELMLRREGAEIDDDQIEAWSQEEEEGCEHLHRLYDENRIGFPFPVLAGTYYELLWDEPLTDNVEAGDWIRQLMAGDDQQERVHARDLEPQSSDLAWYMSEMQSAVLLRDGRLDEEIGACEPTRLQLFEFLALRRSALRSIQRDTQVILGEGTGVSRGRIEEWRRIVATTCDDYVLHDDTGSLLIPVKEHHRADEHVRDLEHLHEQVTRNIDAFQERIDVAGQRAGIVLGVLFGVVAALSFSPVIKQLMALIIGLSPSTASRFEARHPVGSMVVDIGIVFALGVLALVLFRRAASRLPASDRRT